MTPERGTGSAPPLTPGELDALGAQDAQTRSEWMLEDCARHSEAWALENPDGWVLFKLDASEEGRSPWVFPLWPRQELAALGARDAIELPRRLSLDELLESLLPEVERGGWRVLACAWEGAGLVVDAGEFGRLLEDAWNEMSEEDA